MNFSSFSKVRFLGLLLTIFFVVVSILGISLKGFNLGIDFSGGFITEFSTSQQLKVSQMKPLLQQYIQGEFELTTAKENAYWIVRQSDTEVPIKDTAAPLSDEVNSPITEQSWLEQLKSSTFIQSHGITIQLLDSDYIDSQIGEELINQGGLAMLTALMIIMLYLSSRFEWRFALGAILALCHDVVVVLGIFAWTQIEFNLTVLASLLAIIGYSLNDSIIVADRIRELMKNNLNSALDELINSAIKSTLTRTLITSGTTLMTICAVWWLAGLPLQGFSIALFSGVLVGTLSSMCIAATFPELVGLKVNYYQLKKAEDEALRAEI